MTADRADEILKLLSGILDELHARDTNPDRLSAIMHELDAIDDEMPTAAGTSV